ncbi:MAG: T9SS type A sorting domain-containing protein [Flavobacteriales bacterium]|nr:T9SS type A sorting domain-containing protein [Flavobacteriales bacterium]
MYRSFLLASALATAFMSNAQSYTRQVLVLNEGYFNFQTQLQEIPVTLGSYVPGTGVYQTVATISDARFGNHVAVEGDFIFVAADQRLLKYDANTYTLLDEATVPGIRRFAFRENEIVITLGEVGGLSHYCEVRDKNTFDLLYFIDGTTLPHSCEGVQVVGDKAYLAVNNAFDWANTVGKLGILDMTTGMWETSLDLGPDGSNPENIMVDGDAIYALNNKDFTGSSISKVSITSASLAYTTNVALSSGCGSSAKIGDRVYFMEYSQNVLNRYDIATNAVLDTLVGSPATYGLIDDPNNGVMYGTTTDFFSSGELHVMDYTGNILSTVAVGVSPGRLALDTRSSVGIDEKVGASIGLFPNPATGTLTIRTEGHEVGESLSISDAAGRTVMQVPASAFGVQDVFVGSLADGAYTVRLSNGSAALFIKQ